MKNTIKGLAFAAMLALSLLASTNSAFAKDVRNGRETAWTDAPTLPGPLPDPGNVLGILGVTWE
jgi:hypothetical protein